MSAPLSPGTRPVQAQVVLRGVEVRCDEARFPSLLATALAAADLRLPPVNVVAVRVSGPAIWQGGFLGVDRFTHFGFSFTMSSAADVERDVFARAIARAVYASLALRPVPAGGFFSRSPVVIPADGWPLYQLFLGRARGWNDAIYSGRVVVGAGTVTVPITPIHPPLRPDVPQVVVVPEVAVGGRDEWQLSRHEITHYQIILYNLGELGRLSDADGLIGPTTRAAVREFQFVYNRRQNNPLAAGRLWSPRLLGVDGILGPQTQLALDNFRDARRDGSYDGWAAL